MDGAAGGTEADPIDERVFDTDPRGLHERQWLFTRCLARLITYAASRGYEITLAEIGVAYERKARLGRVYADGVHMPASLHYSRLAADLNLFVDGEWITHSDHWAWVDLGDFWLSLDVLAAWGGRFAKADATHVSIRWQGRS